MEKIFKGKTIEDAVAAASEELGMSKDDFTFEVVEMPKSGFLGLGAKPAEIKVSYQVVTSAVEFAENYINGLMDKLGVNEYELSVTEPQEKTISVDLEGEELNFLTKKQGEVIDAIQSMLALAMNRNIEEYYKITVDVNNGKEKANARLENLAVKVAKQVQKTRRKVSLSSMNSAKRRIIHAKLQSFENITTYSVGEEPNRRVVIAYKWPEGQQPPVERERKPYPKNGGKKPYPRKNGPRNSYGEKSQRTENKGSEE